MQDAQKWFEGAVWAAETAILDFNNKIDKRAYRELARKYYEWQAQPERGQLHEYDQIHKGNWAEESVQGIVWWSDHSQRIRLDRHNEGWHLPAPGSWFLRSTFLTQRFCYELARLERAVKQRCTCVMPSHPLAESETRGLLAEAKEEGKGVI